MNTIKQHVDIIEIIEEILQKPIVLRKIKKNMDEGRKIYFNPCPFIDSEIDLDEDCSEE